MEGNAIAFMGAGLGLGLIVLGAGLGIGRLAAGAAEAIGRQPSATAQITGAVNLPLLEALDKRQESIRHALDDAAKAKQELERLQVESQRILAEARGQAESIV